MCVRKKYAEEDGVSTGSLMGVLCNWAQCRKRPNALVMDNYLRPWPRGDKLLQAYPGLHALLRGTHTTTLLHDHNRQIAEAERNTTARTTVNKRNTYILNTLCFTYTTEQL